MSEPQEYAGKLYLAWQDITQLVSRLLGQVNPREFDCILAVTRGGMIPACLVSEATDQRNILTAAVMFYTDVGETIQDPVFLQFPSDHLLYGKRVLVIDDVWDSGKTAVAVRERIRLAGGKPQVAVLHYKPKKNRYPGDGPDYYAAETDAWVVYPWDPAQGWTTPGQGAGQA
ncbi:Xanthine phosphoribosyltransferase [Meiothermus luteus]|jgi:hypoxanthine phosphoribosyltransferase|uniref:Xanthine phosphoribosyltransferase n=1 Tax=Meiothermus luteus TaxID=2026184 RepID=A0A399EHT1_9DEIN|nr:phosphoribosyltransferase family protein [Meiothermus luteus]RIH81821.1 Xanthine phosphoribosyltransferase [Meiothermus luteus]RMH55418.1 MAG: phosphoribosyltransferase [Deinococcota bacterium]